MSFENTNRIQVSEIMTRRPVVIKKGSSIKEAAERMKRYNVGSMPVIDGKKVIGFFTGDDMVFKVLAKGKDPEKTLIDEIMIQDIILVKPQDSIRNAMELLSEHDIKRLPVIDSAGNLVGFLTIKDILRIEPTLMDIAVERLRFSEEKRRNEIKDLVNEENDELLDGL